MIKHGYAERGNWHPLYGVIKAIKQRCTNPNNTNYKYYGGRGIELCREWSKDYSKFIDWALSNGWEEGLEVDRIDNNNGYSPENVRFVTHSDNMRNQRFFRATNRSGYRGVHFDKSRGNYIASARLDGAKKNLGRFSNPVDAAVIRDKFIIDNNLCLPLNFQKL